MKCQTHSSLVTFNNWLGFLKTKSGRGVTGRGDGWAGDFVLRGHKLFLKSDRTAMRLTSHTESRSLNAPL